jgi:hypothetical protein
MKNLSYFSFFFIILWLAASCENQEVSQTEKWLETELSFTSSADYPNAYTDLDFWVEFSGPEGSTLLRPGFWYGDNQWKLRVAFPHAGEWTWQSFASDTTDAGLHGKSGRVMVKAYQGNDPFVKHGLLQMSPGKRNVIHADGTPFLMIGDTPWALPWRGTIESVTAYAENRKELGFNAALLMSLQPDRGVEGPRSRTKSMGFDVAFEDLREGHINQMNLEYFAYFDSLRNILTDHGIVPVFQPVFHGFGWKGKDVLGWNVDPVEYARYCRYLVARYGARPAMWLVSGDADGRNAGVLEGGEEIEKWDTYQQPAGLHYSPFCDVVPDWWDRPYEYIPHQNKVHQEKEWLDFQWCQTGHNGEHLSWKVEKMYNTLPVKASANGEPTYEGIRDSANGAGWWQGHEAWLNFMSGGTMGVVYGAGGLWNWKLTADEPGWPDWANSNASWADAIELPGAVYVGYMAKALEGLDITDIEMHPEIAGGNLCLAHPSKLVIVYLPEGGETRLSQLPVDGTAKWFNPKTGQFFKEEKTIRESMKLVSETNEPAVLIVSANK